MNSKAAAYQQLSNKNELVERHASLVKRIAHHLVARLPASVLVDDLIQAGMIGLLEASRNFDGSKGASFETFAGIRIRGSMLDEIRKGDWTPRSVHKNGRAITEAINQVERETGRDARDLDVAEKSSVTETMLICSGNSKRHVISIAENVVVEAKQAGTAPLSIEGRESGDWVLVDLGDVVLHVMQDDARDFYQLEKLWG